LAIFAAIRRALSRIGVRFYQANKHSSSGKREITQQQKNHQSRQLIGFCNLLLHRPSLACHCALWTTAIATAYPIRTAASLSPNGHAAALQLRCHLINKGEISIDQRLGLGAETPGCDWRNPWRVRFPPIGAPFYQQAFLILLANRVIVARHTQKARVQFSLVYGFFNAPDIRPN
jgi:hypothetical protein